MTGVTGAREARPPASAREAWRRLLLPGSVRPDQEPPPCRPTRLRTGLVVAVLCGLLGFALAVQVRSNDTGQNGLQNARQEDLVSILDDLTNRADRVREEIASLQATKEELTSGTDQSKAALDEATTRAQTYGILAGTVAATGPGIVLTVSDPQHTVQAADLLDALEELRDAGAEAVQIQGGNGGKVRVVASTSFLDGGSGLDVDGITLTPPYRFTVIGDPRTLATALEIPGGVLESLAQRRGASGHVAQSQQLTVDALRQLQPPQYARPAPTPNR